MATTAADSDGDGFSDNCDNCPSHFNKTQADCNDDAFGDVCAIALGLVADCNDDGTPDECETPSPCPGNTDINCVVDIDDIVNVVLDFGTDGSANRGDVDGSGTVDIDDIVVVVIGFGPCPGQ